MLSPLQFTLESTDQASLKCMRLTKSTSNMLSWQLLLKDLDWKHRVGASTHTIQCTYSGGILLSTISNICRSYTHGHCSHRLDRVLFLFTNLLGSENLTFGTSIP